jgi:uncharacterized protein YjbI with pentapeptide repeats
MSFQRCVVVLSFLVASNVQVHVDIYRWHTGEVIPGTEGITPGPGVQLDHHELAYANLRELNLTDSRFDNSNLNGAYLYNSALTNADLTGAVVTGTNFGGTFPAASRRPSLTPPKTIRRRTS